MQVWRWLILDILWTINTLSKIHISRLDFSKNGLNFLSLVLPAWERQSFGKMWVPHAIQAKLSFIMFPFQYLYFTKKLDMRTRKTLLGVNESETWYIVIRTLHPISGEIILGIKCERSDGHENQLKWGISTQNNWKK